VRETPVTAAQVPVDTATRKLCKANLTLSGALQDVPDLSIDLSAGKTYRIGMYLIQSQPSGPSWRFRFAFSGTASSFLVSGRYALGNNQPGWPHIGIGSLNADFTCSLATATSTDPNDASGIIVVTGAGTLKIQAYLPSGGSGTVHAGSWLEAFDQT